MIHGKGSAWAPSKWLILLLLPACLIKAAGKDRYLLAGIMGYSGAQQVTLSDLVKGGDPSLAAFFPENINPAERLLLEKLLSTHAEIASRRAVSSEQVAHALYQHLHQLSIDGVTQKELLTQYKKKSIAGVKQVLAAEIRDKLQVYHFLQAYVIHAATTPIEIKEFYERHIAGQGVTHPPSVMLLQLTVYPKKGVPLAYYIHYLQQLHQAITRHSSLNERELAFKKAIRTCFHKLSDTSVVESGYLSNQLGAPYVTMQEVPMRLQQALYNQGVTDASEGLLSPPYIVQAATGREGVRMVFVKEIREAHPLSLAQDYPHISLVCSIELRKAKFMQWIDLHKKALVYWG